MSNILARLNAAAFNVAAFIFAHKVLTTSAFAIAVLSWFVPDAALGFLCLAASPAAPIAAIASNVKLRRLKTVSYPQNGTANATAPAPSRVEMPLTFVMQDLVLRLTGTFTVAGGVADGTLTAEQPLSFIRSIRIEGSSLVRPNVGQIKFADFASLFRIQQFWKGVAGELTALAIPGVQTNTAFAATVEIDFEFSRWIDPRISLLNSRELASLDLIIEWGAPNDLVTGGDRNLTVNSAQIEITAREYLDTAAIGNQYSIHEMLNIERSVSAADTGFEVLLKRANILRGFLLKQFTQSGTQNFHTPVESIINAVRLELNRERKIDWSTYAALKADNKAMYQLETSPLGYALIDLSPEGIAEKLVDTRDFESVSLIFDVAAPANARLRVYPIQLIPRPGF